MPNTIDFKIETITPEIAREILTRNTNNRAISKRHVDTIAIAITNGHYHLTGEAIRIANDGTLLDGQHRLTACIQANKPFETAVIRGLDTSAMLVIDGGKKRSRQEQLRIARGIDENVTDTALMLLRMGNGNKYSTIDSDTVVAIIDKHPMIAETAAAYKDAAKFRLGSNIAAAELIIRALGYQEHADNWRAVWVDGSHPSTANAPHALRETLIRIPEMKTTVQRTWNHNTRRRVLQQTTLRYLITDRVIKNHVTAAPFIFPVASSQKLLTTTRFDEDQPTPIMAMTSLDKIAVHPYRK